MISDPTTSPAPGQAEPSYATGDDELARKRRNLRAFEQNKRDEQDEGREARKLYHDKQWTDTELETMRKRKQHPVVDNVIKRKTDFLVGIEQRMRRDPKAYPRTPKHERDADVASAGVRFVCDQTRWETVSSECMHDGLISGIGVAWVGIKSGSDGQMDVDVKRVDPARFIYDSRSVKPDFKDARWSGVDLWLDIDEAVEGVSEEIAAKLRSAIDSTKGSGGSATLPADIDQAEQWADYEQRRVRMVEMYELRVAPPYNKPVWHFCKFSADITVEAYVSPYHDEKFMPANPYEAWSPYIDEKGNRYGIVRTMKPLQKSINYKRSRLDHEIGSRQTFSNRGGSVADVDALKVEINKPDGHLEFNGGEWGKDVGIIDRSQVIRGQGELLLGDQARLENYGPNPGLLGKGPGMADSSGRALLAQRDSGMTELSPVFERQRDWKLRVFRAVWARIRQAWTAERWIAVTDDPKAVQFVPVNQPQMDPMTGQPVVDPMTGQPVVQNAVAQIDVDIILDEGPDTMVMREELMQTLANLGEAAVGPLGKVMIELSNAPNKDQLLEMMDQASAPPPEIADMQKRMAKLEELLAASKVDESIANVDAKRVDTITKLLTASTPAAPTTDEFGNVTAMPQGPDPMLAQQIVQAMQMLFPMRYGQPTTEQQAEMLVAQPPMPGGMPDGQEMGGPVPDMPMPSRTPIPMLPPPNQLMPA
jgi:hypothetical protein